MPFDVPFQQWLFARKTFDRNLHDPKEAKLTQKQRLLITRALSAQDAGRELSLSSAQKKSMLKAFDKLYNYFRFKKPVRKTKMRKGEKYFEKQIYWKSRMPKQGKERHLLKQECGDKCFLQPDDLKFPICGFCKDAICYCKPDCAGLLSAFRRARQLQPRFPERAKEYGTVANRALKIAHRQKCPAFRE